MDLSDDLIFGFIKSKDQFPVNFNDAWQWAGYNDKWTAKRSLLNAGFLDGTDFRFFRNSAEKSGRGRPSEEILLTVDCFKSFAMMAGTERGKEVRAYFLRCEAELKRRIEEERLNHRERVLKAVVNPKATTWRPRYEKDFFDEAYRVTGWQRPNSGHPPCMGNFINETVYNYFPEGTPDELRKVNPRNSSGGRSRKHHQHLSTSLGLPILSYQQGMVMAAMRLSPDANPKRFRQNLHKACGGSYQIELPLDELDELDADGTV
jgi:phage anti-repressor protein